MVNDAPDNKFANQHMQYMGLQPTLSVSVLPGKRFYSKINEGQLQTLSHVVHQHSLVVILCFAVLTVLCMCRITLMKLGV